MYFNFATTKPSKWLMSSWFSFLNYQIYACKISFWPKYHSRIFSERKNEIVFIWSRSGVSVQEPDSFFFCVPSHVVTFRCDKNQEVFSAYIMNFHFHKTNWIRLHCLQPTYFSQPLLCDCRLVQVLFFLQSSLIQPYFASTLFSIRSLFNGQKACLTHYGCQSFCFYVLCRKACYAILHCLLFHL